MFSSYFLSTYLLWFLTFKKDNQEKGRYRISNLIVFSNSYIRKLMFYLDRGKSEKLKRKHEKYNCLN